MKVALIHDWLTGMRGGERCLEAFCRLFPTADIYTAIYQPQRISEVIQQHHPQTSFLQNLPGVEKYYRHLLPAFPLVAKSLGRRLAGENYELVISVSHCFAKNVPVSRSALHLSYCLTPMRYVFDQYNAYFANHQLEPLIRQVVAPLRSWDIRSAKNVDAFVAISEFVQTRIMRCYSRSSTVVYPPVATEWITPCSKDEKGDGFLLANALVPYKNSEIVIRAFNQLKLPLTVIGSGPAEERLRDLAGESIRFRSGLSDAELADEFRRTRALVFAAEEDFGMIPVEVMAAGRPVIGLGRGGLLETVQEGVSGVFFSEPEESSVVDAIQRFVAQEERLSREACIRRARDFSVKRFESGIQAALRDATAPNPTAPNPTASHEAKDLPFKPLRKWVNDKNFNRSQFEMKRTALC